MKSKFKNLTAIALAILMCASVIISCPFALDSPIETGESTTSKNRAEMTQEELIAEVAPQTTEPRDSLEEVKEPSKKPKDDLLGDVDADGKVTILDATQIQRWLAELPANVKEGVADTDGDGHISITDATIIQRYLAEIPTYHDIPLQPGEDVTVEHTHLFNQDVILEKPTCEEGGKRIGKCACGAIQTITYYPTGHKYKADSFTSPTCTKDGTVHFTCKNCGEGISKKIKRFGHNYEEIVTDPTCTKAGSVILKCKNKGCDDNILDRSIPALGHDIVHHNKKEATCTEDGYEAYDTCNRCDYTTYKKIKAKGHVAGPAVRESDNPGDESYDEVVYCSVCSKELSRKHYDVAHTHTPGNAVIENKIDATCTKKGSYDEVIYCKECGEEIQRTNITIPEIPHTNGEPVRENVNEATCQKPGSYDEVIYCKKCGEEISRTPKTIEKLAHTPGNTVIENKIDATCTRKGSYDEIIYCKECGEEFSRKNIKTDIDPNAHTPNSAVIENKVNATCIQKGSYDEVVYCKDCGNEISRTTKEIAIDPNAHKIIHVDEVPATETTTGTQAHYKCSLCKKLFSDDKGKTPVTLDQLIIPKLTHSHTPANAVKENVKTSTCVKKGSYDEVIYCSSCEAEISRKTIITDIDPNAHKTLNYIEKVPATCKNTGTKAHYKCPDCGGLFSDKDGKNKVTADSLTIPTSSHINASSVRENVKKATCIEKGSYDEVIYCSVCNKEVSRKTKEIDIDPNAHKIIHVDEVPATETTTGTQAHYKCSLCGKLFSDEKGKNEVEASSLVIPKITSTNPQTCSHHWVKYVIPYNYEDLYDHHRSEIPFTNDKTKNKLNQTNMEAIFQNAGWAIYYCDKCHIADYDRFYTNQEFGRTQEEEEALSLQYVNDLRTSLGLKKMRLSDYTTAVAKERAKELLTDFSHDKMRSGTAENIATCSGGAKRAFELWKESEGHYANMTANEILAYSYFNFGYAYAVVPAKTNAHWRLVMVQVFKRSNMF